jgi:putative membrane protein
MILAVLAVTGALVTAEAAGPSRMRQASARTLTRGFAGEPLATDSLRPAERAFLGKAAEVSRQQMRLAEIGVSQATNSEVRSHAQQLVTDYRSLTDSLEALIRRRGGIPGAPVGGTSENYRKLIEKAGGDFDREFVRTVAQATNSMLTLFEQVASDSNDADVRELAAAELPVLRAHRTAITELEKAID